MSIQWYLPEVSLLERRYQMLAAARELLPHTLRLEKLLGHALGINEEILGDRIDTAIKKQLAEMDITVLPLEPGSVDWPRLIADSASRRPPFEAGKYEKGFRDSIVAETIIQFIEGHPLGANSGRTAIVTGDGLLGECLQQRVPAGSHIRVLRSLDELRELINGVVSDVTDAFVDSIRDRAARCFFVQDDKTTLFFTGNVWDRIKPAPELSQLPKGATSRRLEHTYVGPTRFARKHRQRTHWVTTVRVLSKAYRHETSAAAVTKPAFAQSGSGMDLAANNLIIGGNWTPNWSRLLGMPEGSWESLPGLGVPTPSGSLGSLGSIGSMLGIQDILVASGECVFEVDWSATFTAAKKLTGPSIDGTRCIETTWSDASASKDG